MYNHCKAQRQGQLDTVSACDRSEIVPNLTPCVKPRITPGLLTKYGMPRYIIATIFQRSLAQENTCEIPSNHQESISQLTQSTKGAEPILLARETKNEEGFLK